MDRGYYSEYLVKELHNRGIKFIFRMKSTSNFVKKLGQDMNDLKVSLTYINKNNGVFGRIIRYKIKNDSYFLLTNLPKSYATVDELAINYWKRWSVEVQFKKIKYDIFYNNILPLCLLNHINKY